MSEVTFGLGPSTRIDGPPPVLRRFGLLQAADIADSGVRVVPDSDATGIDRWINGGQVYPYPDGPTFAWDASAPSDEREPKERGEDRDDLDRFAAITVYLPVRCDARSIGRPGDVDEMKRRALLAFSVYEGSGVERELLASPLMPSNPHLADGLGDFPNNDDPTSVLNAVRLLEGAISAHGKAGLIHVSPGAAEILGARGAISQRDPGGVLRTHNGTPVVPGSGYTDGATPPGHDAPGENQEWVYASGPIDVRRGAPFTVPDNIAEALDRGAGGYPNEVVFLVERDYLLVWDTTVHAAVLADLCSTDC